MTMFSKTGTMDTATEDTAQEAKVPGGTGGSRPAPSNEPESAPSLISKNLTISGNVTASGDIQFEGTIDGDISAHLLTVGENATIRGEVVADEVVINGRLTGRIRGLIVRLNSTARVEGDIAHRTIAIEAGAQFEGTIRRQEDPLGDSSAKPSRKLDLAEKTAAE